MRVLPVALALAGALTSIPATMVASDAGLPARRIVSTRWATTGDLTQGTASGVTVHRGTLTLGTPAGTRGGYDYGTWKSPWVTPGFDLTELVPSWNASTPGDSWIRVEVRGKTGSSRSTWDTIASWAHDDTYVRRSSPDSQPDDLGRVSYDTWLTSGVSSWRLRVTLFRRTGQGAGPVVENVGAMVSRLPAVSSVTTSQPGGDPAALGTVLPVPRYSQMVHQGEYPQYDGGGEAWCSPTSTTMVLAYYDALPPRRAYRWVDPSYPDRVVPQVARMVYDTHLGGTGNWPFNTAYAASRTGSAFVTRLRNLREAERFIAAGIPLIASVTFSAGQLSGAPISSTDGHLLVIVGFTKSGDVVVNDPAASSRAGVRRTYDRGQFEDAWLKRYPSGSSMRGSGGLVYVIHDDAHPLPPEDGNRNW
jgi:hypothetical protein